MKIVKDLVRIDFFSGRLERLQHLLQPGLLLVEARAHRLQIGQLAVQGVDGQPELLLADAQLVPDLGQALHLDLESMLRFC
jgi:hypothetical protein